MPMELRLNEGSEVKASARNAGDLDSIPGLGRSPGEGNGNPVQYSWLENPMDGETWWAIVHRVTKSRLGLSDFTFTFKKKITNMKWLLFWQFVYKGYLALRTPMLVVTGKQSLCSLNC